MLNTDLQGFTHECFNVVFYVCFFPARFEVAVLVWPILKLHRKQNKKSQGAQLVHCISAFFSSLIYFLNEIWRLCCCDSSIILLFDAPTVWRLFQKASVWVGHLQHSQTHNKGREKKNCICLVHSWLQWNCHWVACFCLLFNDLIQVGENGPTHHGSIDSMWVVSDIQYFRFNCVGICDLALTSIKFTSCRYEMMHSSPSDQLAV